MRDLLQYLFALGGSIILIGLLGAIIIGWLLIILF